MGFADTTQFNEYLDRVKRDFNNLKSGEKNRIFSMFNKEYCDAKNLVRNHMNWSKPEMLIWMKTDNPLLGGVSPQFMIAHGRGEKLIQWIKAQIELSKAPNESQ